jgi:hypothetical protein
MTARAVLQLKEADWVLFVLFTYLIMVIWRRRWAALETKSIASPPGPRGLPFVGNTHQIPSDHQWLKFDQWLREHGMFQIGFMAHNIN